MKKENFRELRLSKNFARIYFRELRLPNISRGFNFANLHKIREIREKFFLAKICTLKVVSSITCITVFRINAPLEGTSIRGRRLLKKS